MPDQEVRTVAHPSPRKGIELADTGFRCPRCSYNLTGLSSARCPECGIELNWSLIVQDRDRKKAESEAFIARRERLRWRSQPGTAWDSWKWYWKPVAFFVTMFRVALLPHRFAREFPRCPRLGWALLFGVICAIALPLPQAAKDEAHALWAAGALCSVLLLSIGLTALSCMGSAPRAWGFWLAVSCYTSYPLLLAALLKASAAVLLPDACPIYPFSVLLNGRTNPWSTILFYWWWTDVVIIWYVSARPSRLWQTLLAVIVVPLVSVVAPWMVMALVLLFVA